MAASAEEKKAVVNMLKDWASDTNTAWGAINTEIGTLDESTSTASEIYTAYTNASGFKGSVAALTIANALSSINAEANP